MALGKNSEEYHTERVIVINGPTLGSLFKLVCLGAVLGSVGTLYFQHQQKDDGLTVDSNEQKAKQLLRRAFHLAKRTKEIALTVAQSVAPQWEEALETAKLTAAETEHELHQDIKEK